MWIDKDQENKNLEQNPSDNTAIGSGGGAAPVSSSTTPATGTPSSTSSAGQAAPQRFGTIQDYFQGNKAQGEQLGERFTTKLADTQNQQKKGIDQAATQAASDIQANTIGFDPTLVSTAVSNPTKVASDDTQFNKFLNQWNAAYKGPESFEASGQYGQAADAAQKAQEKSGQIESTGGRQQLIQDEFGVYGQGNKGLDEALLQQSSYFPTVQEQAKQFGTLQDYLQSKSSDVGTAAQAAKETTENTKAQTRTPFTNKLTDLQTNLNSRTNAAKTTAQEAATRYNKDFAAGNADQIVKDILEINPKAKPREIKNYLSSLNTQYGVTPDLLNFNNYNPAAQITSANVATPEDYANTAALQKLTGTDYSGLLNPANAAQAGTYNKQGTFDTNNLQTYLKGQLNQQDKELLSKNNVADVAAKLKIPDPMKNLGDVASWSKFANTIIDTAKRSGEKAGFGLAGVGHETNPLGSLVMGISRQVAGIANQNGGNMNIPQLAGIKAAEGILRNYFNNKSTSTWS